MNSRHTVASEDRWVGMRTRPDLVIQEATFRGQASWIAKDPLSMRYFRLQQAEMTVLRVLRERVSYSQLKKALESAFPGVATSLASIQQLVTNLHRVGLLLSDSAGQARPLRQQAESERRKKRAALLLSLLSLRLPGYDPDRFLTRLHAGLRWLFTGWFACFASALGVAALALLFANFEEFCSRLPGLQSFLSLQNVFYLSTLLILTKTLHELGHGLMCKHFGGECHEIGFMLLVFTPAMYCNTSDSWTLPSRWARIAIGAAGMYVEVVLASICTFVWWYTQPGWINYLALNVMFLCSVSTLVFNANPLLRYDGYYILSDLLEVPNLSQKAKLALVSRLRSWCLGMKPIGQRQLHEGASWLLLGYGVASLAYRLFVMLLIVWVVKQVLEPLGLSALADLLIAASVVGVVVLPAWKAIAFLREPGRLRDVRRGRLLVTVAASAAALLAAAFFPLPEYVSGRAHLQPENVSRVVVSEAGRLLEICVRPGDRVQQGDTLARLENRELELELLALQSERSILQSDLRGFRTSRSRLLDAERLISETEVALRSLEAKIAVKAKQVETLTIKAEQDGIVVSPGNTPASPLDPLELRRWIGTPLDPQNLGAWVRENTLICLIGEPGVYCASVLVDQSDISLVEPGQPLLVCVEQQRDRWLNATVASLSYDELVSVPRELSQTTGGPVAVDPHSDDAQRPLFKLYEVLSGPIQKRDGRTDTLGASFIGEARIRVGSRSLSGMLTRLLWNTIHFR